ncbi:MAG TPA: hypothetical protein VJQ61_15910 [Sinomonas sp.]|nr:hypothetical protein [Sinomonas sp.]
MEPGVIRSIVEERWPPGVVASTSVLAEAGIGDRLLTAAVRGRIVIRLRRGAYILGRVWRSSSPWDRDLYRIYAHAASTRRQSVYSHVSAARLAGCSTWSAGDRVHVTVPYSSSPTSHGADVASHSAPVGDADLAELVREGRVLRLTSLNRTVADCARILALEPAAIIGDHALRLGATLDGIAEAAERTGAIRGYRRVERLLSALDPRSESPGETRTRLMLASAGMAQPELQFEIRTEEGLFRADFAWPELRVILEFDGDTKYFDYRPAAEVLLAERRAENALIAAGWIVVRIRWSELATPGVVEAKLRAAFARAAKLAG